MSAPIRHPRDLDDPSIYAPRWLRESSSPPLAGAPAPRPERVRNSLPQASMLPEPGQGKSQTELEPDERDTAIHHLLMHQSLRPQFLPEPPMPERRHSLIGAAAPILLAFCFVAGVVCLFIFGVVPFAQWPEATRTALGATALARQYAPPAIPALQLVVGDLSGRINEPLPLAISVTGSSAGAFIAIAGLAAGTRVTAGNSISATEWRIPVRNVAKAVVLPPQDFAGNMKLVVDLRLSDETVADSRIMNLEWVGAAMTSVPSDEIQPAQQPQARQPTLAAQPTLPSRSTAPPLTPSTRQLDRDEIANLFKRGEELLVQGDVASARLMLQRAADARDPRAALALGATYDPVMLNRLGVLGFQPDPAQAKVWYERAAELGSTDASLRLDRLAQDTR